MIASNNILLLGIASWATVEEKWAVLGFVVGVEVVEVFLGAMWASALRRFRKIVSRLVWGMVEEKVCS